jgi:hypothetical protein
VNIGVRVVRMSLLCSVRDSFMQQLARGVVGDAALAVLTRRARAAENASGAAAEPVGVMHFADMVRVCAPVMRTQLCTCARVRRRVLTSTRTACDSRSRTDSTMCVACACVCVR